MKTRWLFYSCLGIANCTWRASLRDCSANTCKRCAWNHATNTKSEHQRPPKAWRENTQHGLNGSAGECNKPRLWGSDGWQVQQDRQEQERSFQENHIASHWTKCFGSIIQKPGRDFRPASIEQQQQAQEHQSDWENTGYWDSAALSRSSTKHLIYFDWISKWFRLLFILFFSSWRNCYERIWAPRCW